MLASQRQSTGTTYDWLMHLSQCLSLTPLITTSCSSLTHPLSALSPTGFLLPILKGQVACNQLMLCVLQPTPNCHACTHFANTPEVSRATFFPQPLHQEQPWSLLHHIMIKSGLACSSTALSPLRCRYTISLPPPSQVKDSKDRRRTGALTAGRVPAWQD